MPNAYSPKNPSLSAEDFMVPVSRLITLRPEMDAISAIQKLIKHKISGAPVITPQGDFLGVFSEKCSMRLILDAAYEELPSNTVGAFMDDDMDRVISPDTDLLSTAEIFLKTPYRRLPVLKGKKLMGQVSRRDVLISAIKMIDKHGKNSPNKLLYLSALIDRRDSPIG